MNARSQNAVAFVPPPLAAGVVFSTPKRM